jgi:hypothetical protein
MSDALRAQLDASLGQLHALIRRGLTLIESIAQSTPGTRKQDFSANSADAACDPAVRIWQNDCAALVNELSGGAKSHWLSRAFSNALLVRNADGSAVVSAAPADIASRIVNVLEQAVISMSDPAALERVAGGVTPAPRRFDFVHDGQLRPVLEKAFTECTRALDNREFEAALKTTCGILEAIVTDALQADAGRERPRSGEAQTAKALAERSFDERIAAAEQAGLIRNGCARLTPPARGYRDVPFVHTVTERDARIAAQVLRVLMRDLDPGR